MTHWFRRAAGLALVLLTVVPVYRLLPLRDTGATGRWTTETVSIQSDLLWSGFLLLVILAGVAGMLVKPATMDRVEGAIARVLLRPSLTIFALAAGIACFLATAIVTHAVFEARPNLVDALLQLTHARYFAAGRLGGPPEFADGFWHMQNSLVTPAGWFSQYPPGHLLLLAAGFALGAAWIVGPIVLGATAFVMTLLMARLAPEHPVAGRVAGIATALSPFAIAHAATFMNHATAALFAVTAVYAAVRASEGARWVALAGASVTALAAVRPVAAIVVMLVVVAAWWGEGTGSAMRTLTRRGAIAVLGGMPFLVAHLVYNKAVFGGFTTFGYTATWGPSHGLGFHRDPWGNDYGPVEALLYTSADLSALNLGLFEALLPVVTLVGAFLIVARRLSPGERLLTLWALLPVVANAFYWHHGQFMGPRMLTEFAPAWIGLSAVALGALLSRAPRSPLGSRFVPRVGGSALLLAGAGAFVVMGPQRLASYGGDWLPGFRAPLPAAPANSIVFVHGAWETRLMSRLATAGIRLDRVETAMRQNPTCLVHGHLVAGQSGEEFGAARPALPALSLEPSSREYLPRLLTGRDARIRVDTLTRLHPACAAEVRADRFGAVDASFILWLGDLPGIETGRPLFARDLGPALNRRLLARYHERSAWMYGYFSETDSLRLLPYGQGEALLWNAP